MTFLKEQEGVIRMRELEVIWETELNPHPPFNFEHTVQKDTRFGANWYWLTPFERYSQGIMRTGFRLQKSQNPVGIRLESARSMNAPIQAKFFSRRELSDSEKEEAMETVRRCLDLERDIHEFYALAENFPALREAKRDLYGARITPLSDLLSSVVLSITLQMASEGRTEQMLDLLYRNYGVKLRFDGAEVIILPQPEQLAKIKEEDLKAKCKLGYRAKYIEENAVVIARGEVPELDELEKMPSDEAKRRLMGMKGIGEYAAAVITPHPFFPVDVWSVKIFCKLFELPESKRPREMMPAVKEYAQREFGVWQRYAYEYIVNDLENLSERFKLKLW